MFIDKPKITDANCCGRTSPSILKLSLNYLFGFAVLAFFFFTPLSQANELEWDQTKIEIELKPGETEAKAKFLVTNKGKKPIRIDRIKTSCGCTGSILDQKDVEPGESATIIGTFKKGNRQGLNHNQLQVFLEGQNRPVETLHMLVKVPQLIQINPHIVYWNRSSSKTARPVKVKLDKRYLSKISNIEYDSELLDVSETDDPEGKFDRIIMILPKSFEKQLRHTLIIKAEGDDDLAADAKLMIFVQP